MSNVRRPARAMPADARLAWVDSARGLSVLAVVIFHVGLWHFLPHSAELWEPAARAWARFNSILGSVRMPLLLAVSGLVVARRVRLGFSDPANVVRAVANYYLYVVWLVIYAVFFALVTRPDLPHRIDGPGEFIAQFVVPDTTLWYVFALAVYVVVLSALRRVPPWIVLTALALLTIAVRATDVTDPQAYKIAEVAVFFAVGVYAAGPIRRLASIVTIWSCAGLLVLAAVVNVAGRVMTGEIAGSVLFMARGIAFMLASVAIVALLVRWAPAGRVMSAVGRQTLPVYVMHPLLLCGLIVATGQWSGFDAFLGHPLVSLTYPVVVTVLIGIVSLGLHRLAMRSGLGVLFGLPDGARRRLGAGRRAAD